MSRQVHPEPALAVDPAMLVEENDDSEYEYEYDGVDTETFYLNLDLTSIHGLIRPPRRRDPASTVAAATATPGSIPIPIDENNEPAIDSTEIDSLSSGRVQILGLHTPNPIVSFQNQIFSCTWADQIGTELLFTHPESGPEADPETGLSPLPPLSHGKDFDLIAANSVKIIGRKANLISTSGAGLSQDTSIQTPNASGTLRRPGTQTNQARFLERLATLKRQRGETDTVRTVFSTRRTQNLEDRLRGWARTEEQLAEIQRLNEASLQGDNAALQALEELYTQLNNENSSIALPGPSSQSR